MIPCNAMGMRRRAALGIANAMQCKLCVDGLGTLLGSDLMLGTRG